MAAKIKKGDRVIVIAGKDKGTTGTVLRSIPSESRVVVQGVRMMAKHVKPSQADPQGGIKRAEAPIHVSNVALVDGAGKAVRVGFEVRDGKKVRVAKGSGEVING